ncbi:MAG TPA: hypothetical protein VKT22_07045 [Steroidobacteraceae bacterium]|nr:hypothetical protein [Steroidobacteraceae bacterium]
MTLGVVAALAAEGRALRGGTVRRCEQTLLKVSGVGAAAATHAAELLVRSGAEALLSWGVAGALDPALMPGTICLPAAVLELPADGGDGTRFTPAACFSTHGPWRAAIATALRASISHAPTGTAPGLRPGGLSEGLLLSVPEALATAAAKRAARAAAAGAVAVDMESAAVARVAQRAALPFIALRAIVDTASDEIPGSIVRASRAGEVRLLRLAGGLLRSPSDLLALLRLAHRYHRGLGQLRAVARALPLRPGGAARSA